LVTYLEIFVLLQVLDFMTTLVGLRMGGTELSPFIAWVMRLSDPLTGLTVAKLIGFGVVGVCLWLKRPRVIHVTNYFCAGLVVWNLYQILGALGVSY
jgi:hypothetical protein